MLNIGISELLLIAALALVVVGPERLPKLLRMAGRQYAKLRRAANELQNAFMDEGDLLDASFRDMAELDRDEPLPSGLPRHEPVRPKSALDQQSVPADPAAALAAAQSNLAEVREARATRDAKAEADPEPEPVEIDELPRPGKVDLDKLSVDETQGDY